MARTRCPRVATGNPAFEQRLLGGVERVARRWLARRRHNAARSGLRRRVATQMSDGRRAAALLIALRLAHLCIDKVACARRRRARFGDKNTQHKRAHRKKKHDAPLTVERRLGLRHKVIIEANERGQAGHQRELVAAGRQRVLRM